MAARRKGARLIGRSVLILLAVELTLGCAGPVVIGERDAGLSSLDGRVEALDYDECGNGMDDDGDFQIDEGCPCAGDESQSCFSGIYPNRLVGVCRDGLQTCSAAINEEVGLWGACAGDILPVEEVCEGQLDDDCDGAVDEGCVCEGSELRPCGQAFSAGPCSPGTQRCREDGRWSACLGAIGPSAELCSDVIDNDCDGLVNEGCGCIPVPEVCGDAIDNDCDGEADENCLRSCDDPQLFEWVPLTTVGAPEARIWPAVIWTGEEVFLWGGQRGADAVSDGALYNPTTESWRPVASSGAPSARAGALSLWTGREVFVWGGGRPSAASLGQLDYVSLWDGGLYEPGTDSWRSVPEPPAALIPAGGSLGQDVELSYRNNHIVAMSYGDGSGSPRPLILDLATLVWTAAAPAPHPIGSGVRVFDGEGWFLATGGGGADNTVNWLYFEEGSGWRAIAPAPRDHLPPGFNQGEYLLEALGGGDIAVLGQHAFDTDSNGFGFTDGVLRFTSVTGSWSRVYGGEFGINLTSCPDCSVSPQHCLECPETSGRVEASLAYGWGHDLGCGRILASWGNRRRVEDPTLTTGPTLRVIDLERGEISHETPIVGGSPADPPSVLIAPDHWGFGSESAHARVPLLHPTRAMEFFYTRHRLTDALTGPYLGWMLVGRP